MKLTDAERLILFRQHQILALLDPASADAHRREMEELNLGFEPDGRQEPEERIG